MTWHLLFDTSYVMKKKMKKHLLLPSFDVSYCLKRSCAFSREKKRKKHLFLPSFDVSYFLKMSLIFSLDALPSADHIHRHDKAHTHNDHTHIHNDHTHTHTTNRTQKFPRVSKPP